METKLFQEKSGTYFFVPFHYDSQSTEPPTEIWRRIEKPKTSEGNRIKGDVDENREVLYAHIMDFLQGQTHKQDVDVSPLRIYSIVPDKEKGGLGATFWNAFCKKEHRVIVDKYTKETIVFNLYSDDKRKPTIYMHDELRIGFLVIFIESACSTDELIKLNYALHKIGNIEASCSTDAFQVNEGKINNEEALNNALAKGKYAYKCLHQGEAGEWENGALEWDMRGLVDLLICGLPATDGQKKKGSLRLFNNIRMHLLTYRVMDDTEIPSCLDSRECDRQLLYLARCCSPKYILPVDEMIGNGEVLHTFDNVHIASYPEGCAIMAMAKAENASFFEEYDSQIRMRFFWIYLLVLFQRYSMFNISRSLMQVKAGEDDSELWELIESYMQMKATCYWTDVSPFTQHTQFYKHCYRGLRVDETYREIESKTGLIRMVSEHRLRKALEEQATREKDREDRENRREHMLSILVALLTVVQAVGVAFALSEGFEEQWLWTIGVGVVLLAVLIVVILLSGRKKSEQ